MNYLLLTLLGITSFTACSIGNAQSEQRVGGLRALDSAKNTRVDSNWKHLAENSKLIVVGSVDDTLYVTNEKELFKKNPASDGMVQLPNMRESIKGTLIRFKIDETIYVEGSRKIGKSVYVYVKDGYFPPTDTDIPLFVRGKKYLIFLTPLEKADNEKDATVFQPRNLSVGSFDFDYKLAFKVTEKSRGYFPLNEKNLHIIDEIRTVSESLNLGAVNLEDQE